MDYDERETDGLAALHRALAEIEAQFGSPARPTPFEQIERAAISERLEVEAAAYLPPPMPDRDELQAFIDEIGETEFVDLDRRGDLQWARGRWASEKAEQVAYRRRAAARFHRIRREVHIDLRRNLASRLLAQARVAKLRPRSDRPRERAPRRTRRATRAGPARPADAEPPLTAVLLDRAREVGR